MSGQDKAEPTSDPQDDANQTSDHQDDTKHPTSAPTGSTNPSSAPSSGSLSFGFTAKKQRVNVAVNLSASAPRTQAITALRGSKFLGDQEQNIAPSKPVIAPLTNTYRSPGGNKNPHANGDHKFTPSFVPPTQDVREVKDGEDRFEMAPVPVSEPGQGEYGLLRRDVPEEAGANGSAAGQGPAGREGDDSASKGQDSSAGKGRDGSASGFSGGFKGQWEPPMMDPRKVKMDMDARKLKADMGSLPDVADLDAYERMPIEDIGMALLRGYGWKDGEGVGRNRKKVEAIEYVKRPERLGIGAQPAPVPVRDNRPLKMGEKRPQHDMVVAPDASGRPRNIKTLDEKLVARETVAPGVREGKEMRVVGGRHEGFTALVLKLLPGEPGRSERALVKLRPSDENVEVRFKDLAELSPLPSEVPTRNRGEAARAPDGGRENHGSGGRGYSKSLDKDGNKARTRDDYDPRNREENDPRHLGGRESRDVRDRGGITSMNREPDISTGFKRSAPDENGVNRSIGDDGVGGGHKRGRADEQGQDRQDGDGRKDKYGSNVNSKGEQQSGAGWGERGASGRGDRGGPGGRGERDAAGGRGGRDGPSVRGERDGAGGRGQRDGPSGLGGRGSTRPGHWAERPIPANDDTASSSEEEDEAGGGNTPAAPPAVVWLHSHIRVKIVDKGAKGGKLYLKKGTVVDVQPGGYCLMRVDQTGETVRLHQSCLETVVPKKPDALVLVVTGEHKGQRARLLSCNSELAAIQLLEESEVVRLPLDDIADFVGPIDDY